jgi:hypothetical protein
VGDGDGGGGGGVDCWLRCGPRTSKGEIQGVLHCVQDDVVKGRVVRGLTASFRRGSFGVWGI